MKRIISIILPLLLCALTSAAKGSDLLAKCADNLAKAQSLFVNYTVTADGHTADGQLVVQGEMFTVTAPGMRSWYDGTTQWTYSTQMGEVNIITPTPEEVRQINPLAIIKAFSADYSTSQLSSKNGLTTLRLTSKKAGTDITSADITINDKTLYPTNIKLTMSNKQTVNIAIRTIEAGKRLPADTFRFDKNRFPGINVVDLR